MEIRLLREDELGLVEALALEANSLMRNKEYNKFSHSENAVYCGAFNDAGNLISVVSAVRWKRLPNYTITKYYAKPGSMTVFSWKNNPAVAITEMLIDLMEKEGRFTWYYSRSIEKWPERLRIKGNDFFSVSEKCKNYTRYIEEIVEKNTESTYIRPGCNRPKWPYDVIIVKCCLKSEFRPFEYKFEEDYDSEN